MKTEYLTIREDIIDFLFVISLYPAEEKYT